MAWQEKVGEREKEPEGREVRRGEGWRGEVRASSDYFFSSRRRHTRYWRDWSSDVCSSDLTITASIAQMALMALNIDRYGLDEIDNKILLTIIDKFRGGPVGVSTIATAIGEDSGTVEDVYEPFLIMEGFIKRTPRGRMATQLAYDHLGRNFHSGNPLQGDLFV